MVALPMETMSPEETQSLLKSIRRIMRANDLQSRVLARTVGLTGPQLVVLMAVAELGEVTTTKLAQHVELSPATVVTVLENLELRGMVERYRSGSDKRIVFTRLTRKGTDIVSHAPRMFGAAFASRFAALPEARRHQLTESLAILAELMSTAVASPEAIGASASSSANEIGKAGT